MNYYMNIAGFYTNDVGRNLYQEIGLIEEQHVSHYGSLLDPNCTWLENLLMHKYTEAYLYFLAITLKLIHILKDYGNNVLFRKLLNYIKACDLLKKYENKEWQKLFQMVNSQNF